jgi:hypothetical protein
MKRKIFALRYSQWDSLWFGGTVMYGSRALNNGSFLGAAICMAIWLAAYGLGRMQMENQ